MVWAKSRRRGWVGAGVSDKEGRMGRKREVKEGIRRKRDQSER